MAHQYIADNLELAVVGDLISISGAEARHAAGVSRLRVSETVMVTNGRGLMCEADAVRIDKSVVELRVTGTTSIEPQHPLIVLVQALAKGDRDERAIEMATELGVSTIVPWQATRSISRWDDQKAIKGQARWQAIVREASKQSLRAWIPIVESVQEISDFEKDTFLGLTLVLDPGSHVTVSDVLARGRDVIASGGLRIVVGPEGGLTNEEISQWQISGASIVGLGSNILRTSTAGPAVLAIVNEILQRW